jgi:transposase
MGEVQAVTRELVQAARERAGDDVVDRLVASIPGLGQVL